MCQPPKSPAAVGGPAASAATTAKDDGKVGEASYYTHRWPAASTASFPLDKRLNVMFEGIPGVQLSPLYLLEVPLAIYLGYRYWSEFRRGLLVPGFCLYLFREIYGMSLSLHRYFSHTGYKCSRLTQFGVWWLGCLASQGPPLWWASKHRRHHRHCDQEDDPHSPVQRNPMYAWVGWTYLPYGEGPFGRGIDEAYVHDWLKFPELAYGENLHMVPVALCHYACYRYGGIGWAVYVSMWSGIACQLATMYFNVAFHTPEEGGHHVADNLCHGRDIPADPLSNLLGEAYHGWHHVYPRAHHRPGWDLPYYIGILPALKLGLFQGENIMWEDKVPVAGPHAEKILAKRAARQEAASAKAAKAD